MYTAANRHKTTRKLAPQWLSGRFTQQSFVFWPDARLITVTPGVPAFVHNPSCTLQNIWYAPALWSQ
jgi:hypothetical protein